MPRESVGAKANGAPGRLPRPRRDQAPAPESDVRERILGSAAECFKRYGVRRARMEDIALGAGMVRPTLYRYYSSKEALLLDVMVWKVRATNEERHRRFPLEGPFGKLVLDAFLAGFEATRRDKYIQALFAEDVLFVTARLFEEPAFLDAAAEFWEPLLDYGRARGEFRPDLSTREAVRGIMYLQFFVSGNKEFFPGPDRAREFAQTFLVGGLLQHSGAR